LYPHILGPFGHVLDVSGGVSHPYARLSHKCLLTGLISIGNNNGDESDGNENEIDNGDDSRYVRLTTIFSFHY